MKFRAFCFFKISFDYLAMALSCLSLQGSNNIFNFLCLLFIMSYLSELRENFTLFNYTTQNKTTCGGEKHLLFMSHQAQWKKYKWLDDDDMC